MRRLSIILLALLSCICLQGQNLSKLNSFDFSYKVEGSMPLNGSGNAVLAEPCYHVTTNGMDIWCDGKTRWTVDMEAKEVYIEDAMDINSFIQSLNFIKEGNRITGADVVLSDGSKLHLKISNHKVSDKTDISFTFKPESLSKEYVVTDLR